jgi:F-type H+-transporting ATPase subunit a
VRPTISGEYRVINLQLSGEEGFTPPGVKDFDLPPIVESLPYLTKVNLLVFLAVILISVFFVASSRKAAVVPGKMQFAGELVYGFIRNGIAKDILGPEFMRFVPYLFSLFTFVLVNNVFAIVPFLQFSSMMHVGFPYALAILTYLVYHFVGMKKQGVGHYLKGIAFMPGVPKPIYILLTPIELATFFVVRPFTLGLRLFSNMFAGHLLLLVFILGGEYLLEGSIGLKLVAPFSFVLGIGLTFFEFMVQCLQAYIFTLLSALYIAGSLADEH